jgi:DNA repair protein RadC
MKLSIKADEITISELLYQVCGREMPNFEYEREIITLLRDIKAGELKHLFGITEASEARILASIELGRRLFNPEVTYEKSLIGSPRAVAELMSRYMAYSEQEKFAVVLLNVKNQLISHRVISVGTLDETIAHPRDVFRQAVRVNAAGIIVSHNHPSGSTSPSNEDYRLTEQLILCGKTLQIPVLDHVIVGGAEYTSLRRTTDLWNK